jgi:tetratricopeptide (TPR) repeat protein
LLCLITTVAYVPSFRNGFVDYDDSDYVTKNVHVQAGLTGGSVRWAFTTGHASNWHPVTWLSHMLDWQWFGGSPVGPHVVSVLFHVVNTLLVFLALRMMTGALWRSLLVAFLFGLHPMHVESVAWVSERKDVLSAFFFLLTLMAYARYCGCGWGGDGTAGPSPPFADTGERPSLGERAGLGALPFYFLSLLFFALGLMSKPMLVTVPFLLLLLDYWPLRRISLSVPTAWGRLLAEKAPYLALAAVSSSVTFHAQSKGGAVSASLSLGARAANAIVSYARYVRKLFLPYDLSVLYPHPGNWPLLTVLACAALLVAVTVLVFCFVRTRPYLAVGWLWFLGTLVPVIGLVQVGIQSMADRYTYIPAIGLFIMTAWWAGEMAQRLEAPAPSTGAGESVARAGSRGAVVAGVVAAALLVACLVLTVRQIGFWRNTETLFRRAVEVTQNNYLAYNNLGYYLANHGRNAEAMKYYERSIAINPTYADALNNLGYSYANQKNFRAAMPYYTRALQAQPNNAEVHNNIGNALAELGQIDEAIAHYLIALKFKPDHADAHSNLGIALAMKGKFEEAIAQFNIALASKPGDASVHSNLGNAYAIQHKLDLAIGEYRETLRLNPNDARAHNNLGNVYAEQGNLSGAIEEYQTAIRLNRDNPEALGNLGFLLVRAHRKREAIPLFEQALRLKPEAPQVREQLERLRSEIKE